jgi:hypothetical protein
MARGWESKSVEAQQADAANQQKISKPQMTSEQAARVRRLEGVRLSRKHILQQLEATHNQRHREMLTSALTELDKQIRSLEEE